MFKEPTTPPEFIRLQKLSDKCQKDFRQTLTNLENNLKNKLDTINTLNIYNIRRSLSKLKKDTEEVYKLTGSRSNYQLVKLIDNEIKRIDDLNLDIQAVHKEKEETIKWAFQMLDPDAHRKENNPEQLKELEQYDEYITVETDIEKIPQLANRRRHSYTLRQQQENNQ